MQPSTWLFISVVTGVSLGVLVAVAKNALEKSREKKMWQATLRALAGSES